MNLWKPNPDELADYLRQLAGQIEDGLLEVRNVVAYGSETGIAFSAGVPGPFFNISVTGVVVTPAAPE